MADSKPKAKPKAKPSKRREIKDAGQRTVLAAFEMDAPKVASQLALEAGVLMSNMDAKEREKALKPFLDRLAAGPDDKVKVWVKVGQVEADNRDQAVTAVVGADEPGQFRAPNASAWRGRVVRKVPEHVQLHVEIADD